MCIRARRERRKRRRRRRSRRWRRRMRRRRRRTVSSTHLTLPTKRIVEISVVAVSSKKKTNKKTKVSESVTKKNNVHSIK